MSGLATATFFKEAVQMAGNESSFILVLGAAFGILPDTLDFKFARFFENTDYTIDPDPENMDPGKIADVLQKAMNQAYDENRMVTVQLHTVRLSVDTWRRYRVSFDPDENEVAVEIGPVVTTSQVPFAGTEPKENAIARRKIKGRLMKAHDKPSQVDIMSGPSFGFSRSGEFVETTFLPWHRQWSHSYTLGAFFGLLGFLIFGLLRGWHLGMIYGLVIGLGFMVHVTEDLTGFMGGNLLWPFTKARTHGAGLVKAGNPLVNFFVIWFSCMTILFNLNRFNPTPVFHLNFIVYYFLTFVIPLMTVIYLARLLGEKTADKPKTFSIAERNKEAMEEIKEDFDS